MYDDEVLKMQIKLDEADSHINQLMRQVDELQVVVLKREEQLKQSEDTIRTQGDKIKFLEGQVDAYQYCLNCRR